jgi:hypothetical protein
MSRTNSAKSNNDNNILSKSSNNIINDSHQPEELQQPTCLVGLWMLYGVPITAQEFQMLSQGLYLLAARLPHSSVAEEPQEQPTQAEHTISVLKRKEPDLLVDGAVANKICLHKTSSLPAPNTADDSSSSIPTGGDAKRIRVSITESVAIPSSALVSVADEKKKLQNQLAFDQLTSLQTLTEDDDGIVFAVPHTPYFVQVYRKGNTHEDVYFLQAFSDLIWEGFNEHSAAVRPMRNLVQLAVDPTIVRFSEFVARHLPQVEETTTGANTINSGLQPCGASLHRIPAVYQIVEVSYLCRA